MKNFPLYLAVSLLSVQAHAAFETKPKIGDSYVCAAGDLASGGAPEAFVSILESDDIPGTPLIFIQTEAKLKNHYLSQDDVSIWASTDSKQRGMTIDDKRDHLRFTDCIFHQAPQRSIVHDPLDDYYPDYFN